ncbi:MAG: plasmid pRiA4b ORF-3 family protein [Candidatus Methanofastidiosia archaeon]|jgi:hypothetical protein
MKKEFNSVYQFKVTLQNSKPPIWRRIQVPETYNFWDLHVAIQDAMGWYDYHLHEFEIESPAGGSPVRIGVPFEGAEEVLPEEDQKIVDYFSLENPYAYYVYDFGDCWEHKIQLEKICPREDITYPVCIKGKRACPPEDCGGIWGYEELLEIIKNPKHEEYEDMMEWLDKEVDPEHFDPREVIFDDPDERFKIPLE